MAPETSTSYLLKFQIGPVQDFIAQARSTRDLWSGSYLLSWLVAEGIRHLVEKAGGELIFPAAEDQPLLNATIQANAQALLTPNLPNIFVARVSGDAKAIAEGVADAIHTEWQRITDAVWKAGEAFALSESTHERFHAQAARHFSVSWLATPLSGTYRDDYRQNDWHLDAVRQTRDFSGWSSGGWETNGCEKDCLSGREEAVVGGEKWQSNVSREYAHLFKHADQLGAVNVIKRVWHRAYLMKRSEGFRVAEVKTALKDFKIRSTRAIAARDEKDDDDENVDLMPGERYLAAIAFDGDSIGAWMNGGSLPDDCDLHTHHQRFSACLSGFALNGVRPIVEEKHGGFLIYAGGDDVLALVPADVALACAAELRTAFREATQSIRGQDDKGHPIQPDASAGIAIAHFKSPLQDLIRAAQEAERHAKGTIGRPAFSVTLMKRSGETDVWGARWDGGGLDLHEGIAKATAGKRLSGKFPHRVCELLEPYRTTRTGIRRQQDAPDFQAHQVIQREFAHALDRQRQGEGAAELQPLVQSYLTNLGTDTQLCLERMTGLCKTVAFTQRNRPSSES